VQKFFAMERAHVKVHFARRWPSKRYCTNTCRIRKSIETVCLDKGFCDATCLQVNLDNLVGTDTKDIVPPIGPQKTGLGVRKSFAEATLFCIFREEGPFLKATLTWIY
jgi:hypothetical protein